MNCTKCHKNLDISYFNYKNEDKKIYYLHCNTCREKNKEKEKCKNLESYNFTKANNVIDCCCGKQYIAFRDYHIARHNKSKLHSQYILDLAHKGIKVKSI
jgi:hypothetical protein